MHLFILGKTCDNSFYFIIYRKLVSIFSAWPGRLAILLLFLLFMIAGLDDQFRAVLLLKSAVVFFALVAGIHNRFPNFVILIGVLKLFHEWDQSVYIVAVGTNIIANDKFVADGRVHVIPRFQLAVPHMIFLHVHEGGVMIGFAVAVRVPAYMQVIGILFEFG